MKGVVVAYKVAGSGRELFPYWPRQRFDDSPWPICDLLIFLGNLPNPYCVRRINNKDKVLFKYELVRHDGNADLKVSLSKNLLFAKVELLREAALPTPQPAFVNGRRLQIYQWNLYVTQITGDIPNQLVLSGLFNSLRQIARKSEFSEAYIYSVFGRTQKPPGFQRGVKIQSQLNAFLEKLRGYVCLKVDANVTGNISTTPSRSPIVFDHYGAKLRLVAMVWLGPGTLDVIRKFAYCELDATFYTMKPYVMCVPQFIKMNTAYPVGMIIGPSESVDLYEMFYEAVGNLAQLTGINPGFQFPVLSDAGQALKAFCTRHELEQFQCHRHLIEWFGAQSIMRVMFIKLLRSQNFEEFQTNLQLSNAVFSTLNSAGKICQSVKAKYLAFTAQTMDEQGHLQATEIQELKLREWCLWRRGVVTTCSNHAESFHHTLKAAVKPNGKHLGIGKCLLISYEEITKKQREWKRAFTRNFSSYIRDGDHAPDWRYIREVARRFEIAIPPEVEHLPTERQVLERLKEIGEASLRMIEITEIPIHHIATAPWTGPDFPADRRRCENLPASPVICEDADQVTQLARDIYAVVRDDVNHPEPFALVFHLCLEAIQIQHLDPVGATAQAYIAAWEHVLRHIR